MVRPRRALARTFASSLPSLPLSIAYLLVKDMERGL